MNELDDFLAPTLARQVEAEQALISGDPGPRLAMTSTQDPVTVFGVRVPLRSGWDEVSETLRWLAARWSDATDYRFDVVAADVSGDRGGDGDRSRPRRVGSVGHARHRAPGRWVQPEGHVERAEVVEFDAKGTRSASAAYATSEHGHSSATHRLTAAWGGLSRSACSAVTQERNLDRTDPRGAVGRSWH
jgi:hypothetical protein